ncbi:MAG: hypothetical protein AAF628_26535 [Planctomycetota bacterium]
MSTKHFLTLVSLAVGLGTALFAQEPHAPNHRAHPVLRVPDARSAAPRQTVAPRPALNQVDAATPERRIRAADEALERSARRIRYELGRRDGGPTRARRSSVLRAHDATRINDRGGAQETFEDAGVSRVLVYSDNSVHEAAENAARAIEPTAVVADQYTFNSQLSAQAWDLVLVDCVSYKPRGGWGELRNYISGGGRVIMSYWDWRNSPAVSTAFGVQPINQFSWGGQTLTDTGATTVFANVPMPSSNWHDHWVDDGSEFNVLPGGIGLAHIGNPASPVIVLGNGGRTIAAPLIDEAGTTWRITGADEQLWKNMIHKVLATKDILVYDDNSVQGLAAQAALNIDPFGTVIADATTFNGLLSGGLDWDVVLVDCPSTSPTGGWGDLETYVRSGGACAMSFWDWGNTTSYPTLARTFGTRAGAVIQTGSTALRDSNASRVFDNVTMPNADWHENWISDGNELLPTSRSVGLAHFGDPARPSMVLGNCGRTIASFLIDEAGDTWLGDGSGVRLWENMVKELIGFADVLVYDYGTRHSLAQQAAMSLTPRAVIANTNTFDALLTSRSWDVVLVDCPSAIPASGWSKLIAYIRRGGRVVMSFYDWDNDQGQGDPALLPTFDVQIAADLDLSGATLRDSGTTDLFDGVRMPNADWHDHWSDDGDEFVPLAPGLAHIGARNTPTIALGNGGRTIACQLIDEAGDTWLNDGSAVRLWENMAREVLGVLDILVYDEDTNHGLAAAAAIATDPLGTVVADAATFDALMARETWDIVVIDCPNDVPASGDWTRLERHVTKGGAAVMSFSSWGNTVRYPNLAPTFGVRVTSDLDLTGATLVSSGSGPSNCLFAGVSMPNSDWHDHWNDDGDEFSPLAGSVGLAHVGGNDPVVVLGNRGRTLASFSVDEAGATWLRDGSAIQLWKNMIDLVLQCTVCRQVESLEVVRPGVPANPLALRPGATSGPVLGGVWDPSIDHSSFFPTAVIDALVISAIRQNTPTPQFGTLLCGLEIPPVPAPPGANFPLRVPSNCVFVGAPLCVQGVSADLKNVRLTNALDVRLGTF